MASETRVKIGGFDYEAECSKLQLENDSLKCTLADVTAKCEQKILELENVCAEFKSQVEFLKGQIEAYKYCVGRRWE